MRVMDFLNYTHRRGTNVTVRRGYKWAGLIIGQIIQLTNNGTPVAYAEVEQVLVKAFSDIKPEDIRREHDPSCTNKRGLLKAMLRAYPNFYKYDDAVTIVTYRIMK
jgi:hypothetical protein